MPTKDETRLAADERRLTLIGNKWLIRVHQRSSAAKERSRSLGALAALALCILSAPLVSAPPPALTAEEQAVLSGISPDSLRANLSFLASDDLKGRYTPSPELDIAASFIAARFRGAGLEPLGDQDYFQVAHMVRRRPATASGIAVHAGGEQIDIPAAAVSIGRAGAAFHAAEAPVVWAPSQDPALLDKVDIREKVVVTVAPEFRWKSGPEIEELSRKSRAFAQALETSRARAEIIITGRSPRFGRTLLFEEEAKATLPPTLFLSAEAGERWLKLLKAGAAQTVSFSLSAPQDEPVTVRNVVGILRGSDPKLKGTAVMLSAHYDHLGTTETAGPLARRAAGGHTIYNGANDDGSGTVSVIEIASALARLPHHPKRSIIFVTFFGEELGLLGSRYFAEHPPLPLASFAGDVNLEQVGRTDSSKGPEISNASLTGYDYTTVTKFLEEAGRQTGVKVYKDSEASDPFFARSDNSALAEHGVPAITLCVAFEYPDYHGLGDEWQKIDYANMARVDRMVAIGLLHMANSAEPAHWVESNARVKRYVEAQREAAKTAVQ